MRQCAPVKATLSFALLVMVAFPRDARAQIKLYFKDGSTQLVKSYKVEGNRVRYYSLERSEWEEVPLSLVDFKVTERAQAAKQAEQKKILQEAETSAKRTYHLPENTGFLIASGLRLPQAEGLYAYDGTRIITLIQSPSSDAHDKKRRLLSMALPGPLHKSRSLLIIPGSGAGVRILDSQPIFYAQLADGAGANVELLRLKRRKNDRVVEAIGQRFKGTSKSERLLIPLLRKQVAPGLYRLKPVHPLAPGEYALGEVIRGKLNLAVWDFGIPGFGPRPLHRPALHMLLGRG